MKLSNLNLQQILGISVSLNLIAAIFSNGYFAHDDHFLIIEASKSWVEGFDYNNWLPWNQPGEASAEGHSFFYVGIYYCFFSIVECLGINDPIIQIKISQILQAIFMVSITYFGFKLVKSIYSHKIAVYSSLLLCSFYFFPFFSSRTLVEFFCVPFLFSAAYFIQKYHNNKNSKLLLIAGILLGLSFNIRFQTGAFAIGFAIHFLLHKNLKGCMLLTIGGLIGVSVIQGFVDYMIWGEPFMELASYVEYNLANKTSYFNEPWFKYILLVIPGFLIPPFGIFLYLGFFKNYKNYASIIFATSAFILFHTYFPNKQERFIIPALPFIILIGGAYFFSKFNQFKSKYTNELAKGSFYFFIILNTIAVIILSFTYSKKSRVESMVFLNSKKAKIIIQEDSETGRVDLIPLFYSDDFSLKSIKWINKNIVFTSLVNQTNITSTSFDLSWNVSTNSTANCNFGNTLALTNNINNGGSARIHTIRLTGLAPATSYYTQCYSVDGKDTVFSNIGIHSTASLYEEKNQNYNRELDLKANDTVNKNPGYILFYGDENLQERIKHAESVLGKLSLEEKIKPSMVDNIAYVLNPKHNRNMIVTIYKIANTKK